MPSITYDGQSFSIDGRRQWIVSAQLSYAKTPRALWADRIRAAKQAGFNTILVPLPWARHEPRQGHMDFEGDLDLRTFVETIGEQGMHCILRPGPYIGGGWDMGGLPAWLPLEEHPKHPSDPRLSRLRSGRPEFMDPVAKWFGAIADKVKDLQVSKGGPVLVVQVEHHWFCGDDPVAQGYLGELERFLRESGLNVPLASCNNLFQPMENEIEGWAGADHLLAMFRQLRTIAPATPRLLLDFKPARPTAYGSAPADTAIHPVDLQRRFAEALAAGAQVNYTRFHPGTFFGFDGGKLWGDADAYYAAASSSGDTLLSEAGVRTPAYHAVKRLATFASSFGRVFAQAESSYQPVVAAPGTSACTVAHLHGARGGIVFVFGEPGQKPVDLLLPNGTRVACTLGDQSVAWQLFDAHLSGRATLDHCTFTPFAQVGRVFVCYGPAGSSGSLSINNAMISVTAPTGKTPHIEELENIIVVVCSEELIDATVVGDDAVFVGVSELDADGDPVPHPDHKTWRRISESGVEEKTVPSSRKSAAKAPALGDWSRAGVEQYVSGDSERFATIDRLAPMQQLGLPYGYGWLRVRWQSRVAKKMKAGLFDLADRAHIFLDESPLALVGDGPGSASRFTTIPVKKGKHTITLLLDNLGRTDAGSFLDAPRGLYGPIVEASPLKVGKMTLEQGEPMSPLTHKSPLMGLRHGVRTHPDRATWSFDHRKKAPVYMEIEKAPAPLALIVNDAFVRFVDVGARAYVRLEAADETSPLRTGKNSVQLAVITDPVAAGRPIEEVAPALEKGVCFYECVGELTEKAELAFANWEAPDEGAFEPVTKTALRKGQEDGLPCWWRCSFDLRTLDQALFLDVASMTKGQIYLNGRNLCRYFASVADGGAVGPHTRIWLPESWLRVGEPNDLVLFDEHGASPAKVSLVYADAK